MLRPLLALSLLIAPAGDAAAQIAAPVVSKPYQVEWVYKVRYGYQGEFWKIFQKTQVPVLEREKQLGYVTGYTVVRPSLHTSDDARWDFRIVITYANQAASGHGQEIERALFPDHEAYEKQELRRWELTQNHWDLPIKEIDPRD